jgi:uncharacterized protein YndB with AHSA1/START domain
VAEPCDGLRDPQGRLPEQALIEARVRFAPDRSWPAAGLARRSLTRASGERTPEGYRLRKSALVAGVLLCAVTGAAAGRQPIFSTQQSFSSDERRRLETGEVLVRMEAVTGSGVKEGVGTAVVEFPPERVFRAVADLEHWDEWVPFMAEADARGVAGGEVESAQRLELPGFLGTRRFRVRAWAVAPLPGGPRRWTVTWAYVPGSGNVADHRGSWTLVEHGPRRTLATCRLFTDPGGFSPAWAMNGATEKMLRWMFKALRLQANRGRYQD